MKTIFTFVFLIISFVLIALGVKSFIELNNSSAINYTYSNSEKGQIVVIKTSDFQFFRSANTYKIIAKSLSEINLDSTKYDLEETFKDWSLREETPQGQVLIAPSNCQYLNFVIKTDSNTKFEDNLEYLYCNNTIDPSFETL